MKYTICRAVSAADVVPRLPKQFRGHPAVRLLLPGSAFDIVVFSESVVSSRTVQRALDAISTDARPLLVATNLTAEAVEVARSRDSLVLSAGEFAWTDRSYKRIRSGRPRFSTGDLDAALAYTRSNRELVERSVRCGCVECDARFAAAGVERWFQNDDLSQTALCPGCGARSVLPDAIASDGKWELWELLTAIKGYKRAASSKSDAAVQSPDSKL